MTEPNPSRLLVAVQIGVPALSLSPARDALDPALDIDAPGAAEALTRYERSRSPEDMAALPMRPGAAPARWELSPLTPAALNWALSATGPLRMQRAFLAAVHAFTDARGLRHAATVERTSGGAEGFLEARGDWLDQVFAEYGQHLIDEMGALAIQRAQLGPKAAGRLSLPPGLTLPR